MAEVLEQKGEEYADHDDGGSCSFVVQLAEAVIGEHQSSMGIKLEIVSLVKQLEFGDWESRTYMNECCRNNDASPELLDDGHDDRVHGSKGQLDQ
jgi:hypothetical protein